MRPGLGFSRRKQISSEHGETRRNKFISEETHGRQTDVYRPVSAMLRIITEKILNWCCLLVHNTTDLLPCYIF